MIGQPSVYRPDWMRKPNWVVNDCRETDADEEQDDDRSWARLQRPLVSMMRVYAALGRLPRRSRKCALLFAKNRVNECFGDFTTTIPLGAKRLLRYFC